jgi:hypothetical protein
VKKLALPILGVLILSSTVLAKTTLSSLEERVARQPNNARAVYELTREYCRRDSAVQAVDSWKRLASLDTKLASDVFLRAKVAVYLGVEPFFPQLISDSAVEAARFSPDGRKLCFQVLQNSQYNVGTMNTFGGGEFRYMTKTSLGCFGPCFAGSYDKFLYFREMVEGEPGSATASTQLIYNNTAGSGEEIVYTNPISGLESIDWVSDDKPILFSYVSVDTRTWEIGLYDRKAGELKELTKNYYSDKHPRYSSDGKLIVYIDDRQIDLEIRIMDTKGRIIENVAPGPGRDMLPAFGDHDRKVAFCSDRNGGNQFDIFVYDRKTKDVIPVTYNTVQDAFPDFSNDGNWIVFTSNRGQDSQSRLYLVSLNQPISIEDLLKKISEKESQEGGSNGNQSP